VDGLRDAFGVGEGVGDIIGEGGSVLLAFVGVKEVSAGDEKADGASRGRGGRCGFSGTDIERGLVADDDGGEKGDDG